MALSKEDLSTISKYVQNTVERLPARAHKAANIGHLTVGKTITTPEVVVGNTITTPEVVVGTTISTPQVVVGGVAQPKITTSDISVGPPASPTDGDIWIATGVDGNGTRWQFQYNAGSASAYKWEFIGGSEAFQYASPSYSITSANTWTALGYSFTLPRTGDYILSAAGLWDIYNPTGGARYFAVGTTASAITVGWTSSGATGGGFDTTSGKAKVSAWGAGTNVYAVGYSPATLDTVRDIQFGVTPIRIQ